jgi:hypothetical protein
VQAPQACPSIIIQAMPNWHKLNVCNTIIHPLLRPCLIRLPSWVATPADCRGLQLDGTARRLRLEGNHALAVAQRCCSRLSRLFSAAAVAPASIRWAFEGAHDDVLFQRVGCRLPAAAGRRLGLSKSQGSARGQQWVADAALCQTNPASGQQKHRAARQATTYGPKQRPPLRTAAWVRIALLWKRTKKHGDIWCLAAKHSCVGSQRTCYTYYTDDYSYSQGMDAPVRLGTYLTPLNKKQQYCGTTQSMPHAALYCYSKTS